MRYNSLGFVLARRDYSESDRILVLFTQKYGKISVIAKGVRKLSSRKRGHLEIFSYIKFSASRSAGMDILTEAELVDGFDRIRKDLRRVALAYYFVEIINKILPEEEKNEKIFDLLLFYLERLKRENELKLFRKDFVCDMLVEAGFWPKGKKLADPDSALLDVLERASTSERVGRRILS